MRKSWLVAGAFALSAALVWSVLSWDPGGDEGVPAAAAPVPPAPPQASPASPPKTTAAAPNPTTPAEQPTAPDSPAPSAAPTAPETPSAEQHTPPPVPPRTGPVDELKQQFASEPRASGVRGLETAIEENFRRREVPAGLLKSVVCHTTVCRIETHWSPDRAQGFLSATMHLVTTIDGRPAAFDPHLAIDPGEPSSADGSRAIEIYVKPAPASDNDTK